MKQVTKSYLQNLYDMGFTVKDMKSKIKEDFNAEVTVGYLRLAIKRFGLDLRKKPRRTDIVFVDDTVESNVPPMEFPNSEQTYQIRPGYTQQLGAKAFESGAGEESSPVAVSDSPLYDFDKL